MNNSTPFLALLFMSLHLLFAVLPCSCAGGESDNAVPKFNPSDQDIAFAAKQNMKKVDPFRMAKVNLVWSKAKKRLNEAELVSLMDELTAHDKLEMELKRQKAELLDQDGEYEAMVRGKLLNVLGRYGLREILQDDQDAGQRDTFRMDAATDEGDEHTDKLDRKLQKLLKKAEMSGFTGVEIDKFKTELFHHQQKMDEFESLRAEISETMDLSQNSIENFREPGAGMKKAKVKAAEMKKQHQQLKESLGDLEFSLGAGGDDDAGVGFSDRRVQELWLLAQHANFSDEETQSFREELKHFEHKLKKLEFFSREAENSLKDLPRKDNAEFPQAHMEINAKVKDYSHKVKKIETELRNRVTKGPHHEL